MNTTPANILLYLAETRPAGVSFPDYVRSLSFDERAELLGVCNAERNKLGQRIRTLSAMMATDIHQDIGDSDNAEEVYRSNYQKRIPRRASFQLIRKQLAKIWMKNREIEASKVEIKAEQL